MALKTEYPAFSSTARASIRLTGLSSTSSTVAGTAEGERSGRMNANPLGRRQPHRHATQPVQELDPRNTVLLDYRVDPACQPLAVLAGQAPGCEDHDRDRSG